MIWWIPLSELKNTAPMDSVETIISNIFIEDELLASINIDEIQKISTITKTKEPI